MGVLLSYADTDQAWAEWVAWQLEVAGHTVLPRPWKFRSGGDWSGDMRAVTPTAARTIALLSPAYAATRFPEERWRLAFDEDPAWARRRLLPVRVEPVEAAALEAAGVQVQVDLTDLEEPAAAVALLTGIREEAWPARPAAAPPFPGVLAAAELPPGPAFPGPGPAVANLPSRNPHFTGREELFDQLAGQLLDGVAVVTSASGLPGMGVSQLALEYAHRNVRDYRLIWWLAAGTPLLLTNGLDQLG